ncbi:MAG: hypothetical protein U9Q71_07325 [Pseudomonadota bacterium]|nr:hypothetical protein [Pseudomonadota bacterium]
MLLRLIMGTGLIAFGYYMGREVGRTEPIREELKRVRENGEIEAPHEKDENSGKVDGEGE